MIIKYTPRQSSKQFSDSMLCAHLNWVFTVPDVERGSSVVECRTRNRESPGSNPLCYRFEVWAFSFSSRCLSRLSCINERSNRLDAALYKNIPLPFTFPSSLQVIIKYTQGQLQTILRFDALCPDGLLHIYQTKNSHFEHNIFISNSGVRSSFFPIIEKCHQSTISLQQCQQTRDLGLRYQYH